MQTIAQLLSSRTIKFAILLAILSVAQGFIFLLPITPVQQMFVGMAVAVAIIILRALTTQPLSEK